MCRAGMHLPGTCSEGCRVQSFSLGTLLGNKDILRTVERDTHLAVQPFPAQTGKNGGQLVAVRPADIGALFAEALAPDLHVGHLGAFDRSVLLGIAKVAAGEEIAALEDVHAIPILREQRVEIQTDKPFTLVGLHSFPLFSFRQSLQLGTQIELLALLHIHQCFCPNLADKLRGQIPGVLDARTGRLDRPEAAVSGGIPQIAGLGVGGAEEHALTQVRCGSFAKCRTVNIVLPREEGTQCFYFGLLQTRQLADLQDPVPLQFLCSGLILGVAQVQTVGEPFSGQLGDEGAFTNALGIVQYQHGVKFAAGIQHTLDGSAECFPGNGTDIFVIVGTEIVDEQRIHSLYAVPFRQIFDKLTDGMVGPIIRDLRHGDVIVSGGEGAVVGIHTADELGIVRIPPEF